MLRLATVYTLFSVKRASNASVNAVKHTVSIQGGLVMELLAFFYYVATMKLIGGQPINSLHETSGTSLDQQKWFSSQ